MNEHVVLLSVPGLRAADVSRMPNLQQLVSEGDSAPLIPSFPCVTWPVQANLLTGQLAQQHGVIANGFYWRKENKVEMWTAWNEKIQRPQIWDVLHQHDPNLTSAAWFPMLSKGCSADYVCMPAPVHNPDGSESLWCYTKPTNLYGELRDALGHFPLQHFWGPLANIKATDWICKSAALAAQKQKPRFSYLYLPHLDYAAQKDGPDSPAALQACADLDHVLGTLISDYQQALKNVLWLIVSEYTIVPVDHVLYPNRLLRDANMLAIDVRDNGEHLDYAQSRAWALVDHQFSHIFVKDPNDIAAVAKLFQGQPGVDEVLAGDDRAKYGMDHERSGEVIVISTPNSWQAYYWWMDDALAPSYARTVDIHRKPGYDPVELHFDMSTKSIPLDATLIKGSHGAPAKLDSQHGVLLASQRGVFPQQPTAETDVFEIVLRQFGITA